ncbi:hypothetical protein ACGP04_15300 [Piscirickettsia salmonis]|uniref:hypothetical protein n=1 Tax=Piscirickettsia salmonis TaxID=1238 RepID=UPI0039F4FDA9
MTEGEHKLDDAQLSQENCNGYLNYHHFHSLASVADSQHNHNKPISRLKFGLYQVIFFF